jgi:hypothetical protein
MTCEGHYEKKIDYCEKKKNFEKNELLLICIPRHGEFFSNHNPTAVMLNCLIGWERVDYLTLLAFQKVTYVDG